MNHPELHCQLSFSDLKNADLHCQRRFSDLLPENYSVVRALRIGIGRNYSVDLAIPIEQAYLSHYNNSKNKSHGTIYNGFTESVAH